jgi:putative sterol carrier protein
MPTLEEMTAALQRAVSEQPAPRSVTFDLKGEGFLHISGSSVSNDNSPADCTITVSKDDLVSMTKGELDPTTAFMTGRLKIAGDMSAAMALQPILARAKG